MIHRVEHRWRKGCLGKFFQLQWKYAITHLTRQIRHFRNPSDVSHLSALKEPQRKSLERREIRSFQNPHWSWSVLKSMNDWRHLKEFCVEMRHGRICCLTLLYMVLHSLPAFFAHFVATTRRNLLISLRTDGFVETRFLMQPLFFFAFASIKMCWRRRRIVTKKAANIQQEAGWQSKHWNWLGVHKD